MPTRLAVVAALLLGLASACGEREEPLGSLEQRYPVTIEGSGEAVVVPARPERIVALDPGAAEILLALGAKDRLVGIPAGFPRGRRESEARRSAVPVVSPTLRLRVSEIARLDPDLIVASPTTDRVDLSRAGRAAGASVYTQPASSVDDVVRSTLDLGVAVGEPVAARRLASRIRSEVARVESLVAEEPVVRAFVDTGFFVTVPERSLLGDLLVRARGESVAGASPGPEPFPLARLARLEPEVYLATSESGVTLESLRADPGTAQLAAVEAGRFAVLSSTGAHRAGPGVGAALEQVARALHPDAFR